MNVKLRKRQGRKVEYLDENGKWKTTGKNTKQEALSWLINIKSKSNIIFGEFSKNIFSDKSPGSYYNLCQKTRTHEKEFWWYCCNRILERYILPRFKDEKIKDITTPVIQEWYLSLDEYSTKPVSSAFMKKILNTMSIIMKYAVFKGIIDNNPCKNIIRVPETNIKHEAFTEDELAIMFPDKRDLLEKNWSDLKWACYFMILRDTGWRPGEISGLELEGYYPQKNAIYTTKSVDSFSKVLSENIKTSKQGGYKYRLGLLSDQTVKWLNIYIDENDISSGLIFHNMYNDVITTGTCRFIMKNMCEVTGIRYRPPYSFRTTFFSHSAQLINDRALMELMGHKKWRSCYDVRKPEEVIDNIRKMM